MYFSRFKGSIFKWFAQTTNTRNIWTIKKCKFAFYRVLHTYRPNLCFQMNMSTRAPQNHFWMHILLSRSVYPITGVRADFAYAHSIYRSHSLTLRCPRFWFFTKLMTRNRIWWVQKENTEKVQMQKKAILFGATKSQKISYVRQWGVNYRAKTSTFRQCNRTNLQCMQIQSFRN